MKKLSLQWRITLMTALLICSTCMAMNWLIGCSGRHYMDSIGANLSTAIDPSEGAVEYFDPSREGLDPNLTIVIYGAQNSFTATNWYITAAVTLLGGILAYFVSGRALRPGGAFLRRAPGRIAGNRRFPPPSAGADGADDPDDKDPSGNVRLAGGALYGSHRARPYDR